MFDPYRKWLGIQPKEQPPNHYRLLSVDVFESDLDVIEGAADRTMGFVRQYQSGEHAADAARILNELATARLCLLRPEKKAAYDEALRKELATSVPQTAMLQKPATPQKTATVQKPASETTPADLPLSDADLKSRGPALKRKKKTAKSKSTPSASVIIGIGVVACLGLIVFFSSGRSDRPAENSSANNDQRNTPVTKPPSPQKSTDVSNLTASSTTPELKSPKSDQVKTPKVEIEPPKTTEDLSPKMKEPTEPITTDVPAPTGSSSEVVQVEMVRTWQGTLGRNQFGVFSQDGNRVVYGIGNDVLIVDTETGENLVKLSGHKKPVWLARFSSDDRRVVSIGQDDTIRFWDTTTQKQVSLIKLKTAESSSVLVVNKIASQIAFSSANDRRLTVMNVATKAEIRRIDLTEPEVGWKAVTRDFKWGLSNGIRNQTTIWDLTTGVSFQIDNGHHNYCGYFTEDGMQAMLGGGFTWDLWDFQAKKLLKSGTVTGGHVYTIGMLPDMNQVMLGLADGTVWVEDSTTAKKLMSFSAHDKPLSALVVSPDKKFAVTQDQSQVIRLWRFSDGSAR